MAADSASLPTQLSSPHPFEQAAGGRIVQQFTLFAGVGYLFFLLVTLPSIVQSLDVMAWWWTALAMISVYGTGVTTGILAIRRASTSRLRTAASTSAVGYALALALWPLGWNGNLLDSNAIWIQALVGLPALTAAAAWRPVWPFVYLTAVVFAVSAINHAVRIPGRDDPVVVDAAWTLAFCLVPVAASVMGIHSARVLDATRDSAFATAGDAAALEARALERNRLDALTHDGVMTTLLTAARQGRTPSVARQAVNTLAEMRTLAQGDTDPIATLDAHSVLARLRHSVADVDPAIPPQAVITADDESRYPADVVSTLASAASEALRNSVRHAGRDAVRRVDISVSDDHLAMTVADDGIGFDPASVPAHRLGLAVSVRGRMTLLPGGTAEVESAPASGTSVRLEWTRP
ncbi:MULTISPECIES: sensor histidine kinase [unclassified Rhodococcus (in: high G+C Gram-positive bacteria)]|uniref:sensor histidine kinase n=1 Tax=unclassified Rhodococcus (in: high G+C Gram-positive bacteria) TaxID=192944 RepID=UPI0009EB94F8|nr:MULTISPECIES: ATP-binding protein [unclassified Rhodococcus (in: high G+C Gram-positive bacteria)]